MDRVKSKNLFHFFTWGVYLAEHWRTQIEVRTQLILNVMSCNRLRPTDPHLLNLAICFLVRENTQGCLNRTTQNKLILKVEQCKRYSNVSMEFSQSRNILDKLTK